MVGSELPVTDVYTSTVHFGTLCASALCYKFIALYICHVNYVCADIAPQVYTASVASMTPLFKSMCCMMHVITKREHTQNEQTSNLSDDVVDCDIRMCFRNCILLYYYLVARSEESLFTAAIDCRACIRPSRTAITCRYTRVTQTKDSSGSKWNANAAYLPMMSVPYSNRSR